MTSATDGGMHVPGPNITTSSSSLHNPGSTASNGNANGNATRIDGKDPRLNEIVALLGENMPHDQNFSNFSGLASFMSLRLMLLKPSPNLAETEMQSTLFSSYSSYLLSGRSRNEIAVMIARDYMFLKQQYQQQSLAHPSPQHQPLMPSVNVQPVEPLSLSSHQGIMNMDNPGSVTQQQLQQQQQLRINNAYSSTPHSHNNQLYSSSNSNSLQQNLHSNQQQHIIDISSHAHNVNVHNHPGQQQLLDTSNHSHHALNILSSSHTGHDHSLQQQHNRQMQSSTPSSIGGSHNHNNSMQQNNHHLIDQQLDSSSHNHNITLSNPSVSSSRQRHDSIG
mmetsp:Transcript_5318/g.5839  ORF Transcript_5318/g.5839 Transcript_5318/m.5839 type:complete len:335 (+) Transcript_5318:1370-2374(+)